jgi:predicted lipid carrier protein YhbT
VDLRFFRCQPDAPVAWLQQQAAEAGGEPAMMLAIFERHNDPDALNLGFDLYGAYGDGDLIAAWAEAQPLEAINRNQLPAQLTWFPAPFSNPEA